jgi:hypothetical protein
MGLFFFKVKIVQKAGAEQPFQPVNVFDLSEKSLSFLNLELNKRRLA